MQGHEHHRIPFCEQEAVTGVPRETQEQEHQEGGKNIDRRPGGDAEEHAGEEQPRADECRDPAEEEQERERHSRKVLALHQMILPKQEENGCEQTREESPLASCDAVEQESGESARENGVESGEENGMVTGDGQKEGRKGDLKRRMRNEEVSVGDDAL